MSTPSEVLAIVFLSTLFAYVAGRLLAHYALSDLQDRTGFARSLRGRESSVADSQAQATRVEERAKRVFGMMSIPVALSGAVALFTLTMLSSNALEFDPISSNVRLTSDFPNTDYSNQKTIFVGEQILAGVALDFPESYGIEISHIGYDKQDRPTATLVFGIRAIGQFIFSFIVAYFFTWLRALSARSG